MSAVDLPKDFGLIKAICVDGEHRYLPDAPRCGCGQRQNRTVEIERLGHEVIKHAKVFTYNWRIWLQGRGRTKESEVELSESRIALCDAVMALSKFEAAAPPLTQGAEE